MEDKVITWVGSARDEIRDFPEEAKQGFNYALFSEEKNLPTLNRCLQLVKESKKYASEPKMPIAYSTWQGLQKQSTSSMHFKRKLKKLQNKTLKLVNSDISK
jgi:hypothetical protein